MAITKWSIASVWHRALSIRTRELEIARKKKTGQIGRSTSYSPVARSYSASVMLSDGPYSSRFWLSIGIVCAKAVELWAKVGDGMKR
jgi:hypothetical protein